MTELYELPTPAAGRVAICKAAIDEAIKMGFSLNDCARRLGIHYKTFWQAYRNNKIVVPIEKQLPLPAPVAVKQGQSVGGGFRPAHNSSNGSDSGSAAPVVDYGGFDKPKPVRKWDDDK